jgi:hypothetical protein
MNMFLFLHITGGVLLACQFTFSLSKGMANLSISGLLFYESILSYDLVTRQIFLESITSNWIVVK